MPGHTGVSAYAAPDEKVRRPALRAKVGQQAAEWQQGEDCGEAPRRWKSAKDHRRSAAVRLGGQPKRQSNHGRVSLAHGSVSDHAPKFDLDMFQVRVSWMAMEN